MKTTGRSKAWLLTDEQRAAIADAYSGGESCKRIGVRYGISPTTVLHISARKGIPIRKWRKDDHGTPQAIREQVIRFYKLGQSTATIAEAFGISKETVNTIATRVGINKSFSQKWKERAPEELRIIKERMRKGRMIHSMNEMAFHELTDESAYWLGFLIADGTHYIQRTPMLCLQLQARDFSHVQKLRAFLSSSHPIRKILGGKKYEKSFNGGPQALLSMKCGWHMSNKLTEMGVTPRKSKTAKANDALIDNRHFWRGVVDGDGTINLRTVDCVLRPSIGLASASPDLIRQFRDFVKRRFPKYNGSANKGTNGETVVANTKTAIGLIRLLYSCAPVSLDRKQQLANTIIKIADWDPEWCSKSGQQQRWN